MKEQKSTSRSFPLLGGLDFVSVTIAARTLSRTLILGSFGGNL